MQNKRDCIKEEELPYLLFEVSENIYAVNCSIISSIERYRKPTVIVGAPSYIRGIIDFNGQFINVIDLRNLFGLDGQLDEYMKSINVEQRINDHDYWVNTLEQCVKDNKEFMLTDDPTECTFGKWFYSFQTNSNVLKHELKKIEAPHSAVHNTARVVKRLMKVGKHEEAIRVIADLRANEYSSTINHLRSLRGILSKNINEVIIIIDTDDGKVGMVVDSIVNIEHLKLVPSFRSELSDYVEAISTREKVVENQKNHVLLLNTSKLKKEEY